MKKVWSVFLFLILAQPVSSQTQFHYRYGSQYFDRALKVIQTQDGNFVMAGETEGFGSSGNALLMKVNSAGMILWIKDYAGISVDKITDIIELPDQNLVMCGVTVSSGAGLEDGFVMKTDNAGNMIWAKTYGGYNFEYLFKICPDGAGGFYVAGYSYTTNNGGGSSTISRLDPAGNTLWTKWVNDLQSGMPSLTAIASGGVVFCTAQYPGTLLGAWKFSSNGNLLWSFAYTPNPIGSGMFGLDIIENGNGELLVNYSYASTATQAQSYDNCILKLNSSGNVIWNKCYGGNFYEQGKTLANTKDGGVIMCGETSSAGNGGSDASLIKLRPNGSVQWAKTYGTQWTEYPSSAVQTSDSGYVLCGQTWATGTNNDSSKVHLVKTDSLGNTICNHVAWTPIVSNLSANTSAASAVLSFTFQESPISWPVNPRVFYTKNLCGPTPTVAVSIEGLPAEQDRWNVYPNPFSEKAIVETTSHNTSSTFELFNIFGQKVRRVRLADSRSEITRDHLENGVYFYQILSEDKIITRGKILIED